MRSIKVSRKIPAAPANPGGSTTCPNEPRQSRPHRLTEAEGSSGILMVELAAAASGNL